MNAQLRGMAGAVVSFAVLLAIWLLLTGPGGLRPVILPAPGAVWRELVAMLGSDDFARDLATSLYELAGGFVVGTLAGLAAGTALARSRRLAAYGEPVIEAARFVVPFSLVPLVVVWFGVSPAGKLFVVAYACFFVTVLNTAAAIASIDPLLLKAGAALGFSGRRLLGRVVLPAALPRILTGVQLALAYGWVSVIAAEYTGAQAGLGYFITNAQSGLETAKVLAGMAVIGGLGSLFSLAVALLRRRLVFYEQGSGW
jgi:ABC-type nitrate/sulfonate/bicarbonate transport system permease component